MEMILEKKVLDMQLNNTPFIAIYMITYNHELFIEEAVESVMNQSTNFESKLFIGEDCSTDNTREICLRLKEKYPNKIELFLNEKNIGANLNARQIFKACLESEAKYIAILEGDDFWTDPLKLQKQVNFLENNPDYSMCTHVANEVNEISNTEYLFPNINENTTKIIQDYISNNLTATCSLLFRAEYLKPIPRWLNEIKFGDWGLMLFVFHRSNKKMMILKDCMSVYRVHFGGIHGSLKEDNQSLVKAYKMHLEFIEIVNDKLFLKKEFSKEIFKKKINVYLIIANLYKKHNLLDYFKFRLEYFLLKLKHKILYSK